MHTPSYIKYICSKTITHIIYPGDMFGKQSCKSLTFENAHKQESECNTIDCMTHPVTSSYCEYRFLWNSGWMTSRLQNYAENFHACCNHGGLFWIWEATSKNNLASCIQKHTDRKHHYYIKFVWEDTFMFSS